MFYDMRIENGVEMSSKKHMNYDVDLGMRLQNTSICDVRRDGEIL